MNARIPHYALYGHEDRPDWLDTVHFEWIRERSSLHDYDIAPHVHDGLLQLLHVTRGHGQVVIDGQRWPLQAPALVVVPAQHVHGFHFSRDIDGPVVTAAQQPLETLLRALTPELLPLVRTPGVLAIGAAVRQAAPLRPLFQAIERESRQHAGSGGPAGAALLMAVLVQVARIRASLGPDAGATAEGGARTRKAALVERFRHRVDSHFREHRPIADYAAELGITAGQLTRLTRELLGRSALQVVQARLLHEAQRELVFGGLGIKQLAAQLGFADEAYFGRFFRKHTGQAPTAFRAAARQRLQPGSVSSNARVAASAPRAQAS
jgi:AraC family transcriptional regulator, transcriptional activator of pobA